MSKIAEKLIHKRLVTFLGKNNILYSNQYGFRSGHSTINAVTKFVVDCIKSIDDKESTLAVFLDLSKAFDAIDHRLLLDKLEFYGVRGKALEWFANYLSDRKQYVTYNGVTSNLHTVRCGVPQGSVLGPLLFIIYSNDLPDILNITKAILFADDTTVTHHLISNLYS